MVKLSPIVEGILAGLITGLVYSIFYVSRHAISFTDVIFMFFQSLVIVAGSGMFFGAIIALWKKERFTAEEGVLVGILMWAVTTIYSLFVLFTSGQIGLNILMTITLLFPELIIFIALNVFSILILKVLQGEKVMDLK